jgi:hypothetical protein
MQNTLLSAYTPTTYPPFPAQPSLPFMTSEGHTLSAWFTDMTAGQSSPTQSSSLPPTDADDYISSSPSPCSQEDLVGAAPSPGSPTAIARCYPTQIGGHQLPQQGNPPTYPQPARIQRRTSKGKCVKRPKDLKATKRLQGQRKSDNENIEALRELFVPRDAEVRWKKDRLGTSTSQHPYLLLAANDRLQFCTTLRSGRSCTTVL